MTLLTDLDRILTSTQDKYVFLSPTGETLQPMGISTNTQILGPDVLDLYTYVYFIGSVLHQIDINKFLEVVYLDGVLQVEPFSVCTYSFVENKFSIILSVNNVDAKYEYSAALHVSENLAFGTVNEVNYDKIEEVFKDRLIGAINVRVTRDQNGLLTVDSCVVNKGVVPDWS